MFGLVKKIMPFPHFLGIKKRPQLGAFCYLLIYKNFGLFHRLSLFHPDC